MKKTCSSSLIRSVALSGLAGLVLGTGLPAGQAQGSPAPADPMDPALTAGSSPADAAARAKRGEEKFLRRAHASGIREMQLSQLAATRSSDPRVRRHAQQLVTDHQKMAKDLGPLLADAGLDISPPASGLSPANASRAAGVDGTAATPPAANRPNPGPATEPAAAENPRGSARGDPTGSPDLSSAHTAGTSGGAAYGADTPLTGEELGIRGRWDRMMDERKQRKLMETSGPDFDQAYLEFMIDEHEKAVELFEDGADGGEVQVQTFARKYLPMLRQHLEQARQLEKSLD